MRTAFRHKSVATAVLMALGIGMISSAAQTAKTPPPELVQYIRETKHQGFADAKIRSQAVAVGWPAATVDEAFTYLRNEKPSQPDASVAQAAAASESVSAVPTPKPVAALPASGQSQTAALEPPAPKQTPAGKQPA